MSDQRGLALIEILAATAILGIAIAAFFTIVPVAGSALEEGRHVSTATFLAQQKLEEVRGARWNDGGDCLGVSTANNPPASSSCDAVPACAPGTPCTTFADESDVDNGGYSRTVHVSDCATGVGCGVAGAGTDGLRLVTVNVGYRPRIGTDGMAATKHVTLDLLVARQP